QENDTVLLCSDGLYEMITDEEILEIISSDDNLDNITQRLIDSANEKGGRDNITVVLIRFA
ncbi:MAG: SpoIIE family protein phosphatase, partial [Clostridia bacterium]|nr:SpoIIE family protein phosphatase [Clostridia bacterium]